ncbi:hypothetical protein [Pseudomonas sp. NPDC089569]|uniref:hypothetical protein n=1 Tax=Pseudomonas sp. NPDC089569 TaxID=3390722 RepID=UPI003D02CF9D
MSTEIVFTHNGQLIRNPFLTPDGSHLVDPANYYGFVMTHTGGWCAALVKDLGDGRVMLLTDSSGNSTPDLHSWEESRVGLQNKASCEDWESELVGLQDYVENLIANVTAGDLPKGCLAAETPPPSFAFTHEGQVIHNPFLSPDGSQPVDPVTYGFEETETSSGCTALVRDMGDGRVMILTDNGGAHTPDLEDWGWSLVGLDAADGEELACVLARDLPKG